MYHYINNQNKEKTLTIFHIESLSTISKDLN